MKAKLIRFEKAITIGLFQQKIGIEGLVEDGETEQEALDKAKEFVNVNMSSFETELAEHVCSFPENYSAGEVEWAKLFLDKEVTEAADFRC